MSFDLRLWAVILSLCVATLCPSLGRTQGLDIRQYSPAMADNDLSVVRAGAPQKKFDYSLSLQSMYARDPLVLLNKRGERNYSIVDTQLDLMLGASIGLWLDTDVSIWIPFSAYQGEQAIWQDAGFVAQSGSSSGLVDPSIQVRVGLMTQAKDGVDIAFAPTMSIPIAERISYLGQGGPVLTPELLVSRNFGPLMLAFNLGYRVLPDGVFRGIKQEDQLTWRAGLGFRMPAFGYIDGIRLSAEGFGATNATSPFTSGIESPAEFLLSTRLRFHNIVFGASAGAGLVHGIGTPSARGILSISFVPRGPQLPNDRDSDGVLDDVDACISTPEDIDGFQDQDGCPDPDNDHDGFLDAQDECPDEPEDIDQYEDEDGCPDLDHDGDKVLQDQDLCPLTLEDHDGFEDEDGCPDPDNDQDTIGDHRDRCPDDAEDFDRFEDEDGCPETDNDGDGIPDVDDVCPNDAEIINNVEDEDGCPDKGKQLVTLTQEGIRLDERIHFASESHVIRERSYRLLNQVVALLRNHTTIKKLRIEGHTDKTGDESLNLKLSNRRARAVRRYLVRRGIHGDRLNAVGMGGNVPRAENSDFRGRGQNRRVEFIIVEQKSNDPTPKDERAQHRSEDEDIGEATNAGEGVRVEHDSAIPQNDDTTPENDNIAPQNDDSTNESDNAVPQNDGSTNENDSAVPQNDDSTDGHDNATPERDDSANGHDNATSPNDDTMTTKDDDELTRAETHPQIQTASHREHIQGILSRAFILHH